VTSRYFYFWCVRCPTRITVETEAPGIAGADGEPEYAFAESEWVGQAAVVVGGEEHLCPADRCPACEGQLHDLDDLLARGLVPYHEDKDSSELHAAWRKEEAIDGS
jgi:hypothetical protein